MGGNEINWNLFYVIVLVGLLAIAWLLGYVTGKYGNFGDFVFLLADWIFGQGNGRGGHYAAAADDQPVAADATQTGQEGAIAPPNSPISSQRSLSMTLELHGGEITTDDGQPHQPGTTALDDQVQEAVDDDDQTLTRRQKGTELVASSSAACSQGDIDSTSETKEEEAASDDQVQEADDDGDQTLTRRQKGKEPDASSAAAACSQGDIASTIKTKEEEKGEGEEEEAGGHEEDEREEDHGKEEEGGHQEEGKEEGHEEEEKEEVEEDHKEEEEEEEEEEEGHKEGEEGEEGHGEEEHRVSGGAAEGTSISMSY